MAQYLNKVSQQTSRNACYDRTWATYLATSNGLFLNLEKIDVQKGEFDGTTKKDQPVQYIAKSMAFKDSEKLIWHALLL